MALWFFNKVVWFVSAAMLKGILLPSNMAAKTTFCLYLVKRLIRMLRCAVNVTASSFQHFPWSLRAKFVFRKRYSNLARSQGSLLPALNPGNEVGGAIHNFKNHIVVTWPATKLLILRANVCNFRKSVDSSFPASRGLSRRSEFLNIFIFCQNNLYSTLFSKITLKL